MNALTAGGYELLQKLKEKRNQPSSKAENPLLKLYEESQDSQTLSQSFSSRTSLSDTLNSIISISGMDPAISRAHEAVQSLREEALKGIGDREPLRTNTPIELATRSHANEEYGVVKESTPTPALSQDDLSLVQNAVAEVAKKKVGGDPQISEDDLKSAIDEAFGDGISDLFDVQINDRGAGESVIQLAQFEISDLGVEDSEALKTYAANVRENYFESKMKPVFEGEDISSQFQQLEAVLDYSGSSLIADLKAEFKRGQPSQGLDAATERLDSLNLDESTKEKAQEILEKLTSTVESALNSYNESPLSDEGNIRFHSGRYDLAFGRDDVAAKAALTENADDRNPTFRKH